MIMEELEKLLNVKTNAAVFSMPISFASKSEILADMTEEEVLLLTNLLKLKYIALYKINQHNDCEVCKADVESADASIENFMQPVIVADTALREAISNRLEIKKNKIILRAGKKIVVGIKKKESVFEIIVDFLSKSFQGPREFST